MRAEVVPLFGVIGEGAEREWRPETKMPEFDFGTAPEIASEQALGDFLALRYVRDDVSDTRENACARVLDLLGQGLEISIEEMLDVFRCNRP